MPDPRVNVTLRLGADGIAEVDQLAEREQRTRSQMLRLLITKGLKCWSHPAEDSLAAVTAERDALQAKVQRIEQFVDEIRSVDTPLTRSVARLVENALAETVSVNCPDCGHWPGRHDPDSGHCDTCACVNEEFVEADMWDERV